MELKRVVVTGMGAMTPIGKTIAEYADNLKNGVSGTAKMTHFDASNFKSQIAGEVKNFDPTQYGIAKKDVRKLDLFVQYAIASTQEAMEQANFDLGNIDLEKAGVIWGSGIGGIETFLHEMEGYIGNNKMPRFSPFFIPKMISDIASGHISIKYGFMGPNFGTVSACASSTNAIADAFNYIRLGKANVFITGGSEAAINEAGVGGFTAMRALSTRNDDPQTASRPWDVDRDGFVIGEGSGTLVLEEYEHAVKRGATILAEVVGSGASGDAYHLTAPHQEGKGAGVSMKAALEDAGIKPNELDYINAHGTSTPAGDIPEALAIKSVFGDHAYKLNVSSTKSMTGHLLGAAGAVESIASIIALNEGFIPPTINQFNLDPKIDSKMNFTFNEAQSRNIKYALSNTFGFGGHNASVIFKKVD